jgi:carbon monoxide dehydrogenase subunit G
VTVVSVAVEIAAPPERVWAVISDPRNLSHWGRHIESVQDVPATGLAEGVTYSTVLRFMGVRARVRADVLEWSPPHRSVISLTGLLDAVVSSTVEPIPGGRSLLEHEVDYRFRGGVLGEIAARSLRLMGGPRLALRHGAFAQKHQIEGGPPS